MAELYLILPPPHTVRRVPRCGGEEYDSDVLDCVRIDDNLEDAAREHGVFELLFDPDAARVRNASALFAAAELAIARLRRETAADAVVALKEALDRVSLACSSAEHALPHVFR